MCGIAGFLQSSAALPLQGQEAIVRTMRDALTHRGPDRGGDWCDPAAGIALGHRRLAILDLSSAGDQPMVSADGRYVLAFNGEIYNHHELRGELEAAGHRFRGHSDTESLLEGIAAWGLVPTLQRSRGMFALALWDRRERRLSLARDRFGEKPLYYAVNGSAFIFASELKALHRHPDFRPELDRDALCLYLRHNYVPQPFSIYRGVAQVPPGCLLSRDASGRQTGPDPWWSLSATVMEAMEHPWRGSEAEAVEALEALLDEVVAERLEADVPLGALLSGGIDSSLVTALMQRRAGEPVRTFSVGYADRIYDEAPHAARVAAHLDTRHTELTVTPEEALALIPDLPQIYDEPFADASQIPTTLISRLTRRRVTVALTGDGGDELFGGYNRYFWALRLQRAAAVPAPLRRAAGAAIRLLPPALWDRLFAMLSPLLPAHLRFSLPGDKLHKLAGLLAFTDPADLYRRLISHWPQPEQLVIGGREPGLLREVEAGLPGKVSGARRMMYLDTAGYLPGDILTKVDRAAMSASLETRVPLLDHRLLAFAWSLPPELLIRGGQGKYLLRRVLHRHVPPALVERPKMGFAVPLEAWLRGPLRDWAEVLLDEGRLRREGIFEPGPIRRRWAEHLSGRRNWQYPLWGVLMFQAWRERWS
ncbi:MAG: asparagine synthase (glutamine-hydrolyzing) [Gammaproteobacteria bacterium]|nr:MAG: asparagine synthase (glutamine-hydrolyzing) [Gammaproteobacteria bacterium]